MNAHADENFNHVPDPLSSLDEPDEPSDLDNFDPTSRDDDPRWDVFLADDDELDPLPAPTDFWIEPD